MKIVWEVDRILFAGMRRYLADLSPHAPVAANESLAFFT